LELLLRARELYESGRMHDALEAAQAACDRRPKDAEAWWLLGCVSRYANLPGASDEAFRRASELSKKHALPFRPGRAEFVRMVREAQAKLSTDARRRLQLASVQVQELPSIDEIRAGTTPDALTARKRGTSDVLVVYQVNHENRSGTEAQLRRLVERSLSRV